MKGMVEIDPSIYGHLEPDRAKLSTIEGDSKKSF